MTTTINGYFVCQQSQARPSWAVYAEGGTTGGGSVDYAPIATRYVTFTSGAGTLTIELQDIASVADVYEVAVDGVYLGRTSEVANASSTNSYGLFTKTITAGTHTVEVWDIILSYIGLTDPFGGTSPGYDLDPAAVLYTISYPDATGTPKRRHVKIHA